MFDPFGDHEAQLNIVPVSPTSAANDLSTLGLVPLIAAPAQQQQQHEQAADAPEGGSSEAANEGMSEKWFSLETLPVAETTSGPEDEVPVSVKKVSGQ